MSPAGGSRSTRASVGTRNDGFPQRAGRSPNGERRRERIYCRKPTNPRKNPAKTGSVPRKIVEPSRKGAYFPPSDGCEHSRPEGVRTFDSAKGGSGMDEMKTIEEPRGEEQGNNFSRRNFIKGVIAAGAAVSSAS